jgi:hypothetical protein
MSKSPRVIFSIKRIAEGDWQIEAHYPGAEIRYIRGLTSKADADAWLSEPLAACGDRQRGGLPALAARIHK